MTTLDEFTATFSENKGPAHLNRFECFILSPYEANPTLAADRFTSLRVVSVTFPGKNIRTVTNETVYGPTYEMAQGLTYAESVSFNFYLSANHIEKEYFSNWVNFIYKPDTYNLEYYDNYKRDIELYQLDRGDNRVAGIKLADCYPKTVGALEYSQDNGEIGQLTVEFAFREHYMIDGVGKPKDSRTEPKTSTRTGGETSPVPVWEFGAL